MSSKKKRKRYCPFASANRADVGVANGTRKIQGLGKFCSNLEISKTFSVSLFSFSCVSLGLGFTHFWLRGLGVSDFVFWPTIKTMRKLLF